MFLLLPYTFNTCSLEWLQMFPELADDESDMEVDEEAREGEEEEEAEEDGGADMQEV